METTPAGYRLRVSADDVDALRFGRLVEAGRGALAAGHPERAGRTLREALALWRGPPLEEFGWAPFAPPETGRLEDLHLEAVELRVEADLAAGHAAELVGELQALTGGAHVARAPARAADARALPGRAPGRCAGGVPAGPRGPRRGARDRAGTRAAEAAPGDPGAGPRSRRRAAGVRPAQRAPCAAEPDDRPRRGDRRDRGAGAGRCGSAADVDRAGRRRQDAGGARGGTGGRGRLRGRRRVRAARARRTPAGRARSDHGRTRHRRARGGVCRRARSSGSWPPSICCSSSTTASTCRMPPRSSAGWSPRARA